MMTDNPKVDPPPLSNTEKDPDDWVSGDEPMTGAQASYLKTLTEQLGDPDQFKISLTKAEASKRIDSLKLKLERKREVTRPERLKSGAGYTRTVERLTIGGIKRSKL